ncbi:MAG: hypothetical protein BWY82_01206 [Verrucomicrobia bacterium ADurb.Bin474]|nr:MAG: hypothetical protein BWY82_01206 [Verrucomicrobia bacterium ADurb.Bin474]
MLIHAGGHREHIQVEDDILRINAQFINQYTV